MAMPGLDLSFTQARAAQILASTPVAYLKDARLRGSLFDPSDAGESASLIDTQFFVDHKEPSEARAEFERKHNIGWPLGTLPEGHEFLLILKVG